jgi:hypothetical protein
MQMLNYFNHINILYIMLHSLKLYNFFIRVLSEIIKRPFKTIEFKQQ